jgi:hypothetical protein
MSRISPESGDPSGESIVADLIFRQEPDEEEDEEEDDEEEDDGTKDDHDGRDDNGYSE